jgi:hypothetical protein
MTATATRDVYVRRIGTSICATLLDTGNFLMGKDDDAEAILSSLGLSASNVPATVPLTDSFGLMLATLGDDGIAR